MSLAQIAQNAVQLFNGQLLGALLLIGIVIGALYCIFHGHWGWLITIFGAGAIAVTAAWIAQTVYGVAG